jgi:adenylate kinase
MMPLPDTGIRLLLVSYLLLGGVNAAMQGRTVPRQSSSVLARPWGVKQDLKLDSNSANEKSQDHNLIGAAEGNAAKTSNNTVHSHLSPDLDRTQNAPKVVLMGGPSSGKGTQSHRIVERYDVVHLSTGDMLREAVAQETAVGLIAKDYMDQGELVPDEIITKIVLDRIKQPDCVQRGWILDGFPRTRGQAETMQQLGIIPDLFIFLDVPDSELVERVVGRRTDPITGKIYHLKFFPPPTEEIRDRLVQRSDDTVAKMENRLRQFHGNVDSVRQFYDDVFTEVSGLGTPEEISDGIFGAIDKRHLLV